MPDIAEQIAKELKEAKLLSYRCIIVDGIPEWPVAEKQAADIIRQHVAPLVAFAEAAQSYINIRSNHPQEAGVAWRDLCAAEEKLKESRP